MRADIMEQAQKLKVRIDKNQKIADAVDAAGGITVTLEQSDQLGFDWRICAENLERYATGEPLRNLVRAIPL